MIGFYGSPTENKLGIVGNIAKSLFKQEPKTSGINTGGDNQTYSVVRNTEDVKKFSKSGYTFYEWDNANQQYKVADKARAYELIENAQGIWAKNETTGQQHSIDITPSLKAEVEKGLPLFQKEGERAKGAVETLKDGKLIIHALQRPDFSTMVHEIFHTFEKDLTGDEIASLEKWSGVARGTTPFREKFARAGERYLRDGIAPTEGLKPIFEKFKQWLTNIYQSLKGSPIEEKLSPQVKKVFDRLLGEVKNPEIAPKEAISEAIPPKAENIPPTGEIPPETLKTGKKEKKAEGVQYGDKLYQSVEQIQDDFEKFPDFQEYNKVLDQVRRFEDGLRKNATQRSKNIARKINIIADESGDRFNKSVKRYIDDFNVKFFPISISRANTALWKQLVKVRDAASNWIAGKMQEGMQSQTDALRWISKFATNWFAGLGRTESDIMGKLKMTGTVKEFAPYEAKQLSVKLLSLVNSDPESLRRVRDVLDPEIAKEQLKYDDLTTSEQALHDALRELNTFVHETNYANGFIPTDTYLKFKDEEGNVKYIARLYDTYETPPEVEEFFRRNSNAKGYKISADIYKERDEVDKWKEEHAITDPVYLTAKRVMQTIQNGAIKEYMTQIATEHPDFIRDAVKGEDIPKGFTKLSSSRRWGDFRDKVVINHIVEDFTGFFYANQAMNTVYDAMKMFDRNKVNQFYKKFRTVYNPFVQAGNFTGNMFFGSIAGINPLVLVSKMPEAVRDSKAGTDEYKSLLKSGILGATGITGDMTPVTIQNKPVIKNVTTSQNYIKLAGETLGKFDEAAVKLYQGADNIAKYAAYKIFIEQGLTHNQAIRRVYDSFQNYATVGKTWDVASKIPLVGNKFIKFQADLQRMLVNAVTTSPLTTIGTLMLVSLAGTLASRWSGETEEEKEIRESRKGVAKIPFMNTPLSFKIGKKEVNVARYLSPLYLYRYGDSDAELSELSKFLPIQVQKTEKPQLGEKGLTLSWGDPTFGWIAQVLTDRDFRGSSIQNPQASKYFNPNPTTNERIANVLNYVGRTQIPFYKSIQDIQDGINGDLDYYGRKRTWSDAIMNSIIKIQEFNDPELKNYVEGNVSYLTNRFTALSERMGDANSSFLKELKRAKEQGSSDNVMERVYKEQDRIRSARLQKSLTEQVPVMQELERQVEVYKKWYPDDEFIKQNYMNIEAGKNRRFDVLDEIDLQKKYKSEYFLMKDNGLIRKPNIPAYYKKVKLTDEQKKEYSSVYWSNYVRELDQHIGLTQEEINEKKGKIVGKKTVDTQPDPVKITALQKKASDAAQRAREKADKQLRFMMREQKTTK